MNSLVAIAYVPDTESRIKVAADGNRSTRRDVKWIVSPYDEYALEEALRTKEAAGAGTVTVVDGRPGAGEDGPARVPGARRRRGGLGRFGRLAVPGRARDGEGDRGRGRAEGSYDFLWFGQKGVGYDESLVGPMVAELLDLPHVGSVIKLEVGGREGHGAPGDRGRARDRRVHAPGRADRAEGPERAALRVAQGNHGGQEEADRREEARGARHPGGGPGRREDALAKARAAAAAPGLQLIPADDPAAAAKELVRLLREEAKVL